MWRGMIAAGRTLGFAIQVPFSAGIAAYRYATRSQTTFGAAQWASQSDIRKAPYLDDEGLVIGQEGKGLIRLNEPWHVMSYGAPGSGKTASLIIPNVLLNWNQTNIVFDPKGREVERATRAYLESKGVTVHCLDPTEPYRSAIYNPLTYLNWCDRYSYGGELRLIMNEIVPDGDPREEHFNLLAQMIGAGVADDVWKRVGDEHGVSEVSKRLLNTTGDALREYMEGLALRGSPQGKAAASAYNTAGDKERGSHFTTLAKRFELWLDDGIKAISDEPGLD